MDGWRFGARVSPVAAMRGRPRERIICFREEGEELMEGLAGFAAGVVPFDGVGPGGAGKLFGLPEGGEFVDLRVNEVEGGEAGEEAHDGETGEVGAPVFEFVAASGSRTDDGRAVGFDLGAEGVNDLVVGKAAPLDVDESDFVGELAVGVKAKQSGEGRRGWVEQWVGGLVD